MTTAPTASSTQHNGSGLNTPYTARSASSSLPSPVIPQTPLVGMSPLLGGSNGRREQRLIVVSNRLPVTISKDASGEYHFKVSLF